MSQAYNYGNAFLRGLKAGEVSTNITHCYDSWLDFRFKELPLMGIKYHYGSTHDQFYNTTKLFKNMTKHAAVCVSAIEGIFDYVQYQSEAYANPSNYMMAFFQNILANVMQINYIYQDIQKDTKTENQTDLFFNIGRILRIILIVENNELRSSYHLREFNEGVQPNRNRPNRPKKNTLVHILDGLLNMTVGIVNGTYPVDVEKLSECRSEIDI